MHRAVQDVFNAMPLTALVGERILTMHGGLSPDLYTGNSLNILREIIRPLRVCTACIATQRLRFL